jgi:hypothetical protein
MLSDWFEDSDDLDCFGPAYDHEEGCPWYEKTRRHAAYNNQLLLSCLHSIAVLFIPCPSRNAKKARKRNTRRARKAKKANKPKKAFARKARKTRKAKKARKVRNAKKAALKARGLSDLPNDKDVLVIWDRMGKIVLRKRRLLQETNAWKEWIMRESSFLDHRRVVR